MKGTKKLARRVLLIVLPVLAQATTVTAAALTVASLGLLRMNPRTGI